MRTQRVNQRLTPALRGRYHAPVRGMAVAALLALFASSARAGERQLVDEVVAVVDAHSITLSELAAETRIRLVAEQGPAAGGAVLDRQLLSASLRRTVEERIVLSEGERLKLFDLERSEVGGLMARVRALFAPLADYQAVARSIEPTPGGNA